MHLRILDGYTGIAHGLSLGLHGVSCLIGFLIIVESHLEGGTFVLFYTETDIAVIGANGVATIEFTCR